MGHLDGISTAWQIGSDTGYSCRSLAFLPRRANPTESQAISEKYTSTKKNDEYFMSPQDFIDLLLGVSHI
ncbi:hypothetical protein Q5P01_018169 [Channa striata]|uniref:Uncharacterized protein n=1 Tax=Channa striata TaxID=64152 RepID=A0AA88M657_CHASR|nr:hypothetical protein Q5P01_018169 [Channa striata]